MDAGRDVSVCMYVRGDVEHGDWLGHGARWRLAGYSARGSSSFNNSTVTSWAGQPGYRRGSMYKSTSHACRRGRANARGSRRSSNCKRPGA